MNKVVRSLTRTWLLPLSLLCLVTGTSLAQDVVATYMNSGTYDAAAEALKDAFEAETGLEIELVTAPWDILNQNHITDLVTGTGEFDVMSGEFWIANVFDHMLPLDELVERDGYGDTFVDRIWAPGPSNFFDGKRIGVPYSADAYGILYRTDIFEAAGIDADWETWDDFIDRLEVLQEHLAGTDIAPNVYYWGQTEQPPAVFLGMYDGYLVNSEGEYDLDDDKAVAALNQMASLLEYNPSDALSYAFNEGHAVFLQGNAATYIGWPSFIRAAADDPERSEVVGNWELASFPGPGFPMVSAWNLFISKYSDNPDAAWEWIKFYINDTNAKEFMATYGIGSPHRTTYEDEELLMAHAHDYPGQLGNLGRAKSLPWTFQAFEIFFRNTGEMLVGSITAEEVVANSEAAWSDVPVPPALVELAYAQGLGQ